MDPIFDYGTLVRIPFVFLDSSGSVVDPSVVKFEYHAKAVGLTTTLTYGTDATLFKDSAGRYHADIDTNQSSGVYFYRPFATGTGQAARAAKFSVRPNHVRPYIGDETWHPNCCSPASAASTRSPSRPSRPIPPVPIRSTAP